MQWSIMPMQAVQNNRSGEQQYSPQKHSEKGTFADVLGQYVSGGNAIKREDGFGAGQKNVRKHWPLKQSDIDELRAQVLMVNTVITNILGEAG